MGGQLDGWQAGWLHEWVDSQMDGWLAGWMNGWIAVWLAGSVVINVYRVNKLLRCPHIIKCPHACGVCRDDVEEVYPMSKIVDEAKTQKELYSQSSVQETYYSVS